MLAASVSTPIRNSFAFTEDQTNAADKKTKTFKTTPFIFTSQVVRLIEVKGTPQVKKIK